VSSDPAEKEQLKGRSKSDLIDELITTRLRLSAYEENASRSKDIGHLLVLALDVFPDVVLCYDKDERVVFTNDAYHAVYPHSPAKNKIVGCTQEQLLRGSLDAGLIAHPMAKTDPEGWIQMRLEERRSIEGSYTGETVHSTGRTYLYRHLKVPNGSTIIIQSDISDRKEAEQKVIKANEELEQHVKERTLELIESEAKFREFSAISSDWLWEMDGQLRFTYFSERNRIITGFDPSIYIGKTRREIAAEHTADEKWNSHLDTLDKHEPFRDFQYNLTKLDGTTLTISISGNPVHDANGNFCGYRGTGSDVTAHQQAEEARDVALHEAEQANRTKSEFLATMSHEFRTPLNAILGFSEMIRAQYFGPLGSEQYHNYANDIHHSGEHMLALVNDVLDIAAVEAGQRSQSIEAIAINELVNDCIRNVIPAASKGQIEISFTETNSPPELFADHRSVYQILLNLLSNAIKFTEPGGTITVSVLSQGQNIAIIVCDTGIGISSERIPNITEPFSQSHADPHKSQEGTGLGLSIVEMLVNSHGGELIVESEVDVGTSVTVTLPLTPKNCLPIRKP
jgi:PAS domain S-box-containing protein